MSDRSLPEVGDLNFCECGLARYAFLLPSGEAVFRCPECDGHVEPPEYDERDAR